MRGWSGEGSGGVGGAGPSPAHGSLAWSDGSSVSWGNFGFQDAGSSEFQPPLDCREEKSLHEPNFGPQILFQRSSQSGTLMPSGGGGGGIKTFRVRTPSALGGDGRWASIGGASFGIAGIGVVN